MCLQNAHELYPKHNLCEWSKAHNIPFLFGTTTYNKYMLTATRHTTKPTGDSAPERVLKKQKLWCPQFSPLERRGSWLGEQSLVTTMYCNYNQITCAVATRAMSEAVGCWICYWKEDTDENSLHQYTTPIPVHNSQSHITFRSVALTNSVEGAHRHCTNASISDVGAVHESHPVL